MPLMVLKLYALEGQNVFVQESCHKDHLENFVVKRQKQDNTRDLKKTFGGGSWDQKCHL